MKFDHLVAKSVLWFCTKHSSIFGLRSWSRRPEISFS